MNALLSYLLQVTCISGLLYGYYHIALRNKQFHRYNRFYLVGAAVTSLLIPFFNIPVYFTKAETDASFVLQTLTIISSSGPVEGEGTIAQFADSSPFITWLDILYWVYGAVAVAVLLRIVMSLLKIRRIVRANPVERLDRIRFVNTNEPGTPFSFFRWLFWNRDIPLQSEKGEQIFRHELFHIEQRHSLDVIFMELLSVLFWINPFFHLIRKELKAIHEFLADEFAVQDNRKWQYAELLLMQAFHTNQRLVNPFFHNQIKRRIAMITTSQKPRYRYVRKMMVLPLAAIAAALFAFSYKNKQENKITGPDNTVTVMIDAGHGGADHGVRSPGGLSEKDIVLAIAKKIKMLNENSNINIILTRETDAETNLKTRTNLANTHKSELFLSLHINASPETAGEKSGIEIYIPKNKKFANENKVLGSILLNDFSAEYAVNKSLKQAEMNVWVLENTACPSALIEFGYMNNAGDADYISEPANQDKIARSILQSIEQYLEQRKSGEREKIKSAADPAGINMKGVGNTGHIGASGYVEFEGTGNALSFIADSVVFKADPETRESNMNAALYVMNGEKRPAAFFINKKIIAKLVTVYPPDDEYAIKKYGPEAKDGTIVIDHATSTPLHPGMDGDTTKPRLTADKIYEKVQIQATFPGGDMKWREYVERNLNPDIPGKGKLKHGTYTVAIRFIVDKKGKVSNVVPLTKHGAGIEEEAARILKNGPHWNPAIHDGNQVSSYSLIAVTFVVGKDKAIQGTTKRIPKDLNEVAGVDDSRFTQPIFPGGEAKWREYLTRNINPNIPVDSGAPPGEYKVLIQFLVHENGTISDLKPLTEHGYGMEHEAAQLIKKGPRWIPAIKDGQKIKAYVKQSITFLISEEPDDLTTVKPGTDPLR